MNPDERATMFSIYTTDGVKVTVGPDGKPYNNEAQAQASVADRNRRAEQMGLRARYSVKAPAE